MSSLKEYTLTVYRNRKGARILVDQLEFAPVTADYIATVVQFKQDLGYTVELDSRG